MRNTKLSAVASAIAIAAVPAVALAGSDHHGPHPHPGGPTGETGPTGTSGPTGPGGGHHGHHCRPHSEGYVAGGTVDASSPTSPLTEVGHHRYSGTLVVEVTKGNHKAHGDKGKTVTYTLKDARVVFAHGTTNPPAPGDRVQVIGRITTLDPRCDQTGFTPTVTVRQVDVHQPSKHGTTGPSGPSGPSGPTGSTGSTGPTGSSRS